jgi:hypothetical protein
MSLFNPRGRCISNLTLLAVVGGACVAGLFVATNAHALSPDWSRVEDAQLEVFFWDCDARATQEVLSAGAGAVCAMAHDELRRRRFDGDLERLLAWWRAHKADEHGRRGAADTATNPDELALQAP